MFNIGLLALVKMTEKDKDYNVSQTEPVDTANSSVQKILQTKAIIASEACRSSNAEHKTGATITSSLTV